jgi:type VI secretion system protein ImpG
MLRLRLERVDGQPLNRLDIDSLPIYLHGSEALPARLYEQLLGHLAAVTIQPVNESASWRSMLPPACVTAQGFEDDQALLPLSARSFRGYRLLHEYFAFPERYRFVQLAGLREALRGCSDSRCDVVFLLDEHHVALERIVGAAQFMLFCTPAANLFPWRADRIALDERRFEHHIVPDRTRPLDFEVYAVQAVRGYRGAESGPRRFLPFYRAQDPSLAESRDERYFQLRREPRMLSDRERLHGSRSRYVGS